jgi:ABC-2 type transport system permease protein
MRVWAEERKQGTIEFLLTSPIHTWHIVIAKFVAALTLIALCLLLTVGVVWTVSRYGKLDAGPVIGGYLGALMMGGTLIAIGMFLSSFTADQIVSFLLGVIVLLALVLLGHYWFSTEYRAGSVFGAFAQAVSPSTHFDSIERGVVDVRNVYYFVSLTGLFLYLNTRVIDLRRWR